MKHNWERDENGNINEWAWESGFHSGVFCVDCGKSVCVHCNPDYMELDDCTGHQKPKVITNADRIRAMSDEELASEMNQRSISTICDIVCQGDCKAMATLNKTSGEVCEEIIMEWLRQPAEEEP